jgi:hypothetical protein
LDATTDELAQGRARGIAIAIDNSREPAPASIEWNSSPWVRDRVIGEIESVLNGRRGTAGAAERVEQMFEALDRVASQAGGRLKNRATTIIVLQFIATILATINAALLHQNVEINPLKPNFEWKSAVVVSQLLFCTELILVSTAFVLTWTSRWTKLKSKWRQTRFGAEIMRGIIHGRGLIDPLYPVVSEHDPAWHRFALSIGLRIAQEQPIQAIDWEDAKLKYLRNRIEVQRQAYFQRLHAGASRMSAACRTVAFWAGGAAPICLLLALYLKFAHEEWVATSLWSPVLTLFLPVLLPLLAGTSTSLRVVTDAGRRAERYQVMARRLKSLNRWLPTLRTPTAIRRAVVQAETILLDELIEWHAASQTASK